LCRLFSEAGIIEWDASARAVRLYRADDRQWTIFPEPEPVREPGYLASEGMYIDEMRRFVRAAAGEESYSYTLAEDGRTRQAPPAAELSSERGIHVTLPT